MVGIGTATPTKKLDVAGVTRITEGTANKYALLYENKLRFTRGSDGGETGQIDYNGSDKLTFNSAGGSSTGATRLDFQVNSTSKIVIDNEGDVGIGTTSPGSKLQVYTGNTANANNGITLMRGAGLDVFGIKHRSDAGGIYRGAITYDAAEVMTFLSAGNVGIGTTSPTAKLHVSGNIWASGSSGHITASGNISASKNLIVSGAIITNTLKQGSTTNTTTGIGSHAEGTGTTASGSYSHAEGSSTTAIGLNSHAEGQSTTAYRPYSHAEGYDTQAQGYGSHAEGQSTIAQGNFSHAEGSITTAQGYGSHAEGFTTIAQGQYSHAEGQNTTAQGYASHAEGFITTASGDYSHAEGIYAKAIGDYSHAEGQTTRATAVGSHAEGFGTTAQEVYSHAEGGYTIASGYGSHAEGNSTLAQGYFSHAEGVSTTASGDYSHAEGLYTVTSGSYQHAQGQYNISSSAQSAFIIGNGTGIGVNRSNLVFASGSQFQITGSLTVLGNITASNNISASGTITATSFTGSLQGTASYAESLVTNPVIFIQGSFYTNIQATITPIPGIIEDQNGDQFNQYKIQGIGTFTGTQVYVDLICVVAGSTNSMVYNNVSTVVAEYPGNGPVSSPMGGGTLIEDFTNGVLSVATVCTILDDNTIGAATSDHYYLIVLDTNATDGRCVIHIDFTILVPIADTVTFIN
jgi:hypothetical protein